MIANLKKIKLLFKAKTQQVNSNSGQGGDDQRHNTEVDKRIHSGDAKIADLVREYLQTKEKTRMGGGKVGMESRKGKGRE
jgi:hypothetical protein